MSSHPKHPKCPNCSRSMYKTMEKGRAVSKADPWAYCRNAKCKLHGVNQSGELTVDDKKAGKTEPDKVDVAALMGKPAEEATPEEEHEAIAERAKEAGEKAAKKAEDAVAKDKAAKAKKTTKKAAKKAPTNKAKKAAKKAPTNKAKKAAKKAGAKKTTKKAGAKKTTKAAGDKGKGGTSSKSGAKSSSSSDKAPAPKLGTDEERSAQSKKNSKAIRETPDDAAESEADYSGLPAELIEGRGDKFKEAVVRIQDALDEKSPFAKNICEISMSHVNKHEGPEAAAALVAHFDLSTKFGIEAPAA